MQPGLRLILEHNLESVPYLLMENTGFGQPIGMGCLVQLRPLIPVRLVQIAGTMFSWPFCLWRLAAAEQAPTCPQA
jgi:hypothetical protein